MEMTKLTGLWKHKDKNGNTYLSGSFSGITQLSVMPNKFKKSAKDPDYFAYITPNKKKEGQSIEPKLKTDDQL